MNSIGAESVGQYRATALRLMPRYAELADRLLQAMAESGLRPGDRLGTEMELAQRYEVSRATVRQALAMLDEDGYISRQKARGTFVKRAVHAKRQGIAAPGVAVVLVPNEQVSHVGEDVAFATTLRGIERSLTNHGFAVQILGVGQDETADRRRVRALGRHHGLVGIVAMGSATEPYQEILPDVPVVKIGTYCARGLPWVGADVEAVCRASIEHLLSYGHRDVAMICGAWVDGDAYALFANGYRAAFEARGLPYDRSLMYHAYPGESLETLAHEVLTGRTRPTAVFAENWKICEAVASAASESGLRIPDDVSLIGYGQNVLHLTSPVAITAYVPDSHADGERSGELLSAIIAGAPEPEKPVLLLGRLVERNSVRRVGEAPPVEGDR